jgi:hypothetical protein
VANEGPADFRTIQAAVGDANDGDTVLVAPGTYTSDGNRDIDFRGKAITVRGEADLRVASSTATGRARITTGDFSSVAERPPTPFCRT